MREPATLLVYCGHERVWLDSEIDVLVNMCSLDGGRRYNLLLLEVCENETGWEVHSTDMICRLNARADAASLARPTFYVASWGTEGSGWTCQLNGEAGFLGLYWNGAEERPDSPPPEGDYNGASWELWIPYTAGCEDPDHGWGLDNLFSFLDECTFPNEKICVQPNVYQISEGGGKRGWWFMTRCCLYAARYGMMLEMEFDEMMNSTLWYYRLANAIDPSIFGCVYGGAKQILKVEELF